MERRADASLLNLCDGVLSEALARPLPERLHSPFCDRQWPGMYAALADGKITIERRHALCVSSVLTTCPRLDRGKKIIHRYRSR